MQGGPLPNDFAVGPRVLKFVAGNPGKLVGCGIAYAVAAGLDGVHLDRGQFGQDIGYLLQPGPVELHVLPGADVGVALVIDPGDLRQFAQLFAVHQPVGHRDA